MEKKKKKKLVNQGKNLKKKKENKGWKGLSQKKGRGEEGRRKTHQNTELFFTSCSTMVRLASKFLKITPSILLTSSRSTDIFPKLSDRVAIFVVYLVVVFRLSSCCVWRSVFVVVLCVEKIEDYRFHI